MHKIQKIFFNSDSKKLDEHKKISGDGAWLSPS